LGVTDGVHTQLQLRVVRAPALRADQQTGYFGFDDFLFEQLELKALTTTVALTDAVFTGSKPIAHD
jgi:hypothetical protein